MTLLGKGCHIQRINVFLEISDFVVPKFMLLMALLYHWRSRMSSTVMQGQIQNS